MNRLFIKPSKNTLKTKFTLIYILNCTDMLFTYTLLKTGYFYEANWIMRPIVSSPFLSVFVKIIFPALLILGLLPHLKENNFSSLKLCRISTNGVVLAYLAINILHVYYIIEFLKFL